jgi:O-glycosyl hydrolase
MRVGITGTSSGVNMTAFLKVSTGAFCIVAVNTNSSAVVVPVSLGGLTAASVTPHLTSATASLAAQSAIPAGKSFAMNLPALSVTSFVGTGS